MNAGARRRTGAACRGSSDRGQVRPSGPGFDRAVAEEAVGGGPVDVGAHVVPVGELADAGEVVGRDGLLVAGPELVEGGVDVDDEPVDGSGNGGPGHGSSSLTSRVRSM